MKFQTQLQTAFDKMPDQFSSNQFSHELRVLDVPNKFILSGGSAHFLKQYAMQVPPHRKVWVKREQDVNSLPANTQPKIQFNIEPIEISVDEAIAVLKSRGYKVMKPVTEFVEA